MSGFGGRTGPFLRTEEDDRNLADLKQSVSGTEVNTRVREKWQIPRMWTRMAEKACLATKDTRKRTRRFEGRKELWASSVCSEAFRADLL
jgi:hypothetical protein